MKKIDSELRVETYHFWFRVEKMLLDGSERILQLCRVSTKQRREYYSLLRVACVVVAGCWVVALLITGCGKDQEMRSNREQKGEHSSEFSAWQERIIEGREEKDRMFAGKDSPLPEEMRSGFSGLSYYPPDITYRVDVRFERFEEKEEVTIGTSTGKARQMSRVGRLHFVIGNDSLQLTAFESVPPHGSLFIPFGDESNSIQTYAGGRYIDLSVDLLESTSQLDFNEAYNPYCAYSEAWSCPLVPRENYLPVPIQAGEKAYAK
ncbi:MAG: DUF1684 domain-containing protein [Candidatus Kapaibacterium sp.]